MRNKKGYKKVLEFYNGDEFVADIWSKKYGYVESLDKIITPPEAWEIIAKELSSVQDYIKENQILATLRGFKFTPAGRILHGLIRIYFHKKSKSKKKLNIGLSNCLYIGGPEDSIESIMDYAKQHAVVLKHGYGNGINLNGLRPKNSPVSNAAMTSAGIVPFMKLFSEITNTIGHAGRRGASIITLDVSHPDIKDFILAKTKNENDITGANISVVVDDKFMNAVINDDDYNLSFKNKKINKKIKIKAKEIFDLIIKSAWDWGEPGIIFKDRLQTGPLSVFDETMPTGVNPCGEVPLSPYSQCLLGSIMLDKFIYADGDNFSFDMLTFELVTDSAVKILNAVLDYELKYDLFPKEIPQIKEKAQYFRQIGLGYSGLADVLGYLKYGYNANNNTINFIEKLNDIFSINAFESSQKVAYLKDENIFDNIEKYITKYKTKYKLKNKKDISKYINRIKEKYDKQSIVDPEGRYPINMAMLSIAPTGSLSIIAGGMYSDIDDRMIYTQCSSGIEPVIFREYNRLTKINGKDTYYKVSHNAIKYLKSLDSSITDDDIKILFPTIKEVNPIDKVKIQSTIQKYIDNSISSTVNLPNEATEKDVYDIYKLAWELNCKGITVFRDGCKRMGIIVEDRDDYKENKMNNMILDKEYMRPTRLYGFTEKFKFHDTPAFITMNVDEENNPKEFFMNISKSGELLGAMSEALGRLLSLVLYYDVPINEIIKQLEDIAGGDPIWHKFTNIKKPIMIKSIPDSIAKLLKYHLNKINDNDDIKLKCPKCNENTLIKSEGCIICTNCGYSKCG